MERMISYCGLVCSECPAYVAKKDNDDERRIMTAKAWSCDAFIVNPEDISCDGCLSVDGEMFKYCGECNIRECGTSKKVENCGACSDYGCDIIKFHTDRSPESKVILDEISRNRFNK